MGKELGGYNFWKQSQGMKATVLGVIELFELEGTFNGHQIQPHCNEQEHPTARSSAQSPSSLPLRVWTDGSSTSNILRNMLQCFTIFIPQDFIFVTNLNLPFFS